MEVGSLCDHIALMHAGHFSNEEFERPPTTFIQPNAASNVLNSLCPDAISKQEITRHIVNSLFTRDVKFIRTDFHAKWAMECLGYSFSLPMDQYEIIRKATSVYTRWLLPSDSEPRPDCIAEEEGFYQREIIGHFSLLFVDRQSYQGSEQQRHADLCKSALGTLRILSARGDLAKDTWNTLLKVLMLISRPLLNPQSPRFLELTSQLSPLLIKILLEVWVRSNTREKLLWADLNDCFSKWSHHQWLIQHWSSLIMGLTKRVVHMLYAYGTPKITFEFSTNFPKIEPSSPRLETIEVDMALDQVVYFWYQFMSMMLYNTKENGPIDPENDAELVKKVAQISDYFLEVCDSRNSSHAMESPTFPKLVNVSPSLSALSKEFEKQHFQYLTRMARMPIPSATGMLEMLGTWLFAHATRSYTYDKGRAHAIGALCRILCKASGPVREDYLAKFYSVTLKCLDPLGPASSEFIKHSLTLLTLNHKGIRQLLTENGIPKVVEKYLTDSNCDPVNRRACYSVLSTYVALPYYYLSLPFLSNQTRVPPEFRQHYAILGQNVKEVLQTALEIERDPDNLKVLAWLICVFLSSAPDLTELEVDDRENYILFVNGIVARLEMTSEWQLSIDLIEVLTALAYLLRNRNMGDTMAVVRPLVMKLCELITSKFTRPNSDLMVSALYICLLAWIVSFPTVFREDEPRRRCLEVAAKGIAVDTIKEHAGFFQTYLLNRLELQLPPFRFSNRQELTFSVSAAKINSQNIDLPCKHYLVGEEVLVSLYDSSKFSHDHDEALVVVRDCLGRFVWKSQIHYRRQVPQTPTSGALFRLGQPRRESSVADENEPQTEAALIGQLDESEQEEFSDFSELIRRQKEIDREFLATYQPQQTQYVPQEGQDDSEPAKSHRMLLSSIGLLSPLNVDNLFPVEGQEVSTLIRSLDRLSERDTYHLTVIYLQIPETTEATFSKNQYSQTFQDFMRDMGLKVSGENGLPPPYEHLSELAENIGAFLYCSDFSFEFITISPSIMSAEKLKGCSYQRLTQFGEAVLLWNERLSDPYSEKQPQIMENNTLKKKNLIVITPLGKGLSKVKLALKRSTPGPLQNDMVVPNVHLAQLVIRTVISLTGTLHSNRTPIVKRRKELLSSLAYSAKKQGKSERTVAAFVHAFRP